MADMTRHGGAIPKFVPYSPGPTLLEFNETAHDAPAARSP
ncbi:hypothetical protein ABH994_003838 [Bradyrhizobium yuanmingense]